MSKVEKFDDQKPRMDLIPSEILVGMADVFAVGAKKYTDRNWENGTKWGRYYGALQRHLVAFWGGEDVDPETGKSHLHHAACCLAILTAHCERGIGEDDRTVPVMSDEQYDFIQRLRG